MFRDSHRVPVIHAKPVEDGAKLVDTDAVRAAREWTFASAPVLILAGTVGTGKSLAAAWALWDRLVMTSPVNMHTGQKIPPDGRLWISAQDVCNLNPQWSPDRAELDHLKAVPFLVVDDVGAEDGVAAKIDALICSRCADGLRTIVTTNLGVPDFVGRYGERLRDRVRQGGLVDGVDRQGNPIKRAKWWVQCRGESLRGVVEPTPAPRLEHDDVDASEEPVVPHEKVVAMLDEFQARMSSKEGA